MELDLTQHHQAAIDAGNFTTRVPSKENQEFQDRLFDLWSKFEDGKITEKQLLVLKRLLLSSLYFSHESCLQFCLIGENRL